MIGVVAPFASLYRMKRLCTLLGVFSYCMEVTYVLRCLDPAAVNGSVRITEEYSSCQLSHCSSTVEEMLIGPRVRVEGDASGAGQTFASPLLQKMVARRTDSPPTAPFLLSLEMDETRRMVTINVDGTRKEAGWRQVKPVRRMLDLLQRMRGRGCSRRKDCTRKESCMEASRDAMCLNGVYYRVDVKVL